MGCLFFEKNLSICSISEGCGVCIVKGGDRMGRNRPAQVQAEQMIRKYSDLVYRVAYSYTQNRSDADDVFQETFLRYVRKKPKFASDEHEKAWFIRVTVNCAKKQMTSAWKRHTVSLEEQWQGIQPEEIGLQKALAELPGKYRTVIYLYYYEGYSTEEIAGILSRKPSTIRSQLTRARDQLERLLKEE